MTLKSAIIIFNGHFFVLFCYKHVPADEYSAIFYSPLQTSTHTNESIWL
ncbi:hypothetical protein CSB66_3206 [Enterobacter hormaechei]|nr:hypothetical protein CSB66_3206 [Enterobacter hormaechei]